MRERWENRATAARQAGEGNDDTGRDAAANRRVRAELSCRRRRDGRADPRLRLDAVRAGRTRAMAAKPQDRHPHHADLAPAHLDRLGRRPAHLLQRSLQGHHRRPPSACAGPADRAGLARNLVRHQSPACHRDDRYRGHLCRAEAPDHGAQWLPRGDLLHVLVQPGAGRPWRHRRHHLRQQRRYRARARRSATEPVARTGRVHRRGAHARRRVSHGHAVDGGQSARPAVCAALSRRARQRRAGAGWQHGHRRGSSGRAAVAAHRRGPPLAGRCRLARGCADRAGRACHAHRRSAAAGRRLERGAHAGRDPAGATVRRNLAARCADRRAQSLPPAGRRLPQLPEPGRGPDQRRHRLCPRVRGRAPPRRGAG